MDIRLEAKRINGTIKAIASKSHAHRYLICAALADRPSDILFEESSEDILATINCLKALGAEFKKIPNGFRVYPIGIIDDACDVLRRLECNESGSTFRFMLPIIGALGVYGSFELKGRLAERPITPLYDEMISHGCIMSKQGETPFVVKGRLVPGEYIIKADISSQFISGLLFALPLLERKSILRLTGKIESSSYIEMTLDAVRSFGINIEKSYNENDIVYTIEGNQKYSLCDNVTDYLIEGDWSNIAFMMCAAAINGEITCTGLNLESRQGDKKIINILKRYGADVEILKEYGSVRVKKDKLFGIDIDASDIPDLVPVLAVVASVAKGKTTIFNASRLRLKESDRIKSVCSVLKTIGADIIEKDDGMIINGRERLLGGVIDSYNDHRIAMMAAIASTVCTNDVVIKNAEAVNKSYPTFFTDFEQIS